MQEALSIDQLQTRTIPSLPDLMNMLVETPLFKAVNDIEELVRERSLSSEVAPSEKHLKLINNVLVK